MHDCNNDHCTSNCRKMRALVQHICQCKVQSQNGCVKCRRMWLLLQYHAKDCVSDDDCLVPKCAQIRTALALQQLHTDNWYVIACHWEILESGDGRILGLSREKSPTASPCDFGVFVFFNQNADFFFLYEYPTSTDTSRGPINTMETPVYEVSSAIDRHLYHLLTYEVGNVFAYLTEDGDSVYCTIKRIAQYDDGERAFQMEFYVSRKLASGGNRVRCPFWALAEQARNRAHAPCVLKEKHFASKSSIVGSLFLLFFNTHLAYP